MTFTTSEGETEAVFTFRYENVNATNLSFSKKQFVNAVLLGKLGVSNKRKTVGDSHDKCTLVFLRCLPDDLHKKVTQGKLGDVMGNYSESILIGQS